MKSWLGQTLFRKFKISFGEGCYHTLPFCKVKLNSSSSAKIDCYGVPTATPMIPLFKEFNSVCPHAWCQYTVAQLVIHHVGCDQKFCYTKVTSVSCFFCFWPPSCWFITPSAKNDNVVFFTVLINQLFITSYDIFHLEAFFRDDTHQHQLRYQPKERYHQHMSHYQQRKYDGDLMMYHESYRLYP